MAWCLRTAAEQARGVRGGEVTSAELVAQHVGRIERLDGRINAVVVRTFDAARRRAAEADAALARGEVWGPLHGVPVTVKESWMLEGTPTTSAQPDLQGYVAEANALSVQRYLDAGAVILGKTNLPPYAADCQSANKYYGQTNNPYDLSRTPGGSSGGSAAALACGFAALELGTDIGGSIRGPACWSGVCGHKPSYGLGHLYGCVPGTTHRALLRNPQNKQNRARMDPSFHHALAVGGPMARSCADLELAMRVLSPPEPDMARNGWSFTLPPARATDARALRAAAWFEFPDVPVDAECLALMRGAAAALEQAGAAVDYAARPFSDDAARKHLKTFLSLLQSTGGAFDGGKGPMSHAEWKKLEVKRNFIKEAYAAFFERYDVLICPMFPIPAIEHTRKFGKERKFRGVGIPDFDDAEGKMIFWSGIVIVADLPSTVVPVGLTPSGGLPIGVQIVAPNWNDLTSIEVGKMLERHHPPSRYVPPPGFAAPDAKL